MVQLHLDQLSSPLTVEADYSELLKCSHFAQVCIVFTYIVKHYNPDIQIPCYSVMWTGFSIFLVPDHKYWLDNVDTYMPVIPLYQRRLEASN